MAEVTYLCSKQAELNGMQKDLKDLKVSNQEIREKIFNGLSDNTEKTSKEVGALRKDFQTFLVTFAESKQSKAAHWAWRLGGTALISLVVGSIFVGSLILSVRLEIIPPEAWGKILSHFLGG